MKKSVSFIAALLLTFSFAFSAPAVYAENAGTTLFETSDSDDDYFQTSDDAFLVKINDDGTAEIMSYLLHERSDVTVPAVLTAEDEVYIVTSIGEGAFYGSETGYVIIPDTVESIGKGAFLNCPNLKEFVVPDSVESIGDCAFGFMYDESTDEISPIEEFRLYGYDEKKASEYASSLGIKYENASSLIRYSEYNGEMTLVSADKRLHKANIPASIDGKPVTAIGAGLGGFTGCTYFGEITIPDTVRKIGSQAFAGTALDEVILPSGITEIGFGAFESCIWLVDITLPGGLTKIEKETFADCVNLEKIDLSDKITSIGDLAFFNCRSFKTFEIPSSVKSIGNHAFLSCSDLERIKVSEDNKNYYDEDGVLFRQTNWAGGAVSKDLVKYPDNREGEEYTVPSGIKSVSEAAFNGCRNLKRVKISSGTEQLKENAFSDSDSLESVTVPSSVWIMEKNFENCPNLTVYAEEAKAIKEFEEKWKKELPLKIEYIKPESTASKAVTGDVSGDGKVDITDVSLLAVILADKQDMTSEQRNAADVNKNGDVGLDDLAAIKQFVAKIIEKF